MEKVIYRCLQEPEFVTRSGDNETMFVEGYALKFGKETRIGGKKRGFYEVISRSAFNGADLNDVVFTYNHDESQALARTANGSLKLDVDSTGLFVRAQIIDTTDGRDVYKRIAAGIIRQMSFKAVVDDDVWTAADDNTERREIKRFGRFYDVAAVTFPAYSDTSIVARSIEAECAALAQTRSEKEQQRNTQELIKRQMQELDLLMLRNKR